MKKKLSSLFVLCSGQTALAAISLQRTGAHEAPVMRGLLISIFMFWFFLLVFTGGAFGQSSDSTAVDDRRTFHQDSLEGSSRIFHGSSSGLDTAVVKLVAGIQATYKAAVYAVEGDASLSDGTKRDRIDSLIRDKNRKLQGILTREQWMEVIPTTELLEGPLSLA